MRLGLYCIIRKHLEFDGLRGTVYFRLHGTDQAVGGKVRRRPRVMVSLFRILLSLRKDRNSPIEVSKGVRLRSGHCELCTTPGNKNKLL